ncbi:hypothetical protein E1B28_013788 [Marasmius oreades]|uniref:Hydrophobin n=1 Tax=Marasmius oreades TaxID=181124 RepID=A0A9P7RRA6_9AGAR|nr:uncharacterized protein E1B28_013788 [Marasmius oreades]KAG7087850.1 hypothetical protein E1B28_013788 [Marasmius oreades]
MLFSKFFVASAVASFAAATALEKRGGDEHCIEQCPGLQCCQQTGLASSSSIISAVTLLDPITLLGILLALPATVLVGVNCSPITVIGGSNGPCDGGTTVICNDNSHGGLLNIGCVPVTI